jgi:hypothetical protein
MMAGGIGSCHVLRTEPDRSWRYTLKGELLRDFFRAQRGKYECVLFMDADDCIVLNSPDRYVGLLDEYDYDLLFSVTADGRSRGMPDPRIERWGVKRNQELGIQDCYLNSGGYLGRTGFLEQVLDRVLEFVDEGHLLNSELTAGHPPEWFRDRLPEYPRNIGADQTIFRHVEPEFYPRMQIDYRCRLAPKRNSPKKLSFQ